MTYLIVAILLGLVAIAIFLLSLRLLIGASLLQWLRGSAGLLLVALSVGVGLAAWDLRSYQRAVDNKPVATLAFSRLDDRHFAVSLVDQAGNEQRFQLDGEMWQLDIRELRWTGSLARLGLKPGYRASRLLGRYLSLEDEQKLPHATIDLGASKSALDVWSWLNKYHWQLSPLEAVLTSASYLPMADGAMYSVTLDNNGLAAHPLNERAQLAVEHWQ